MNNYEPENALQKEYDDLQKSCLCTMRETCPVCEWKAMEQRSKRQVEIIEECIDINYQLYQKGFPVWEPYYPIDYEYWKEKKMIKRRIT